MQVNTTTQNAALLVLRIAIAAIFFYAAYAKFAFWSGAPEGTPQAMVYLVQFLSVAEPLGALALLGGFLTRWAAGGLAIIMVGAILVMQFMMQTGFATATGAGWSSPKRYCGPWRGQAMSRYPTATSCGSLSRSWRSGGRGRTEPPICCLRRLWPLSARGCRGWRI